MQRIEELLRLTREGIPWALARFNDGEMTAIVKRSGTISRGAQEVTEDLADALEAALKYRRHNYWIGLPCATCWKRHRQEAVKRCSPKWYPHTTLAVVLTNRNHQRWQEEFPEAVKGRRIIWIGGVRQDFLKLPFAADIEAFLGLSETDAFIGWAGTEWETVQVRHDHPIAEGSVVMCSCGPLGRVIAHRWFEARPDLTIIDVGSIYDPVTLGRKTARIHKGTLPPCPGCH